MTKPSLDSFAGSSGLDAFSSNAPAAQTPQSFSDQIWGGLSGVSNALGSVLPGKEIGKAVGTSLYNIGDTVNKIAHGDLAGAAKTSTAGAKETNVSFGKVTGDTINAVALPASLALAAPASFAGAVGQYGALGAAQAGGQSLANGNNAVQAGKDAVVGGAIGGATGGVFNLLGKAVSKIAPAVSSVTSGVPKAAIEQAGVNPSVTKAGVGMDVQQVRQKAVSSLQSLYNDLNKEHTQATSLLGDQAPANAPQIASSLAQKAQSVLQQFKVGVTPTAEGLATDFSKSAIVSGGEENVVNKALQTISTWDDFSEKGLQTLNQRINALKNYNEGAVSKSSAIVGQIHNAISDAIKTNSPALADLNESYSTNKKVLDNISDVIGGNAKKPSQIQASVGRLDNIFKDNKDEYLNIIKQLGERSGVDYLSLLAGGEFQKLLPGYIRSAVAVGSVGGIGSVATNPLSLLLLPLFSPRAVGVVARNAPAIADTSSTLVRAGASQAIQKIVPKSGQ